jgi:hypothetical protein
MVIKFRGIRENPCPIDYLIGAGCKIWYKLIIYHGCKRRNTCTEGLMLPSLTSVTQIS